MARTVGTVSHLVVAPASRPLVDGVFIVTLCKSTNPYHRSGGKADGIILFEDPGYAFGSVYEYVYRIV